MHVVTFYSFKGGVGRTMALVNTAAELAQRGRKVLIVDFDLEAPGIPTYKQLVHASNSPGVVDYVSEFLTHSEAPNAADYITECQFGDATDLKLWVMSAGRRDSGYASRLAAIDWQRLYRDRDGYLLFEDLKEQWRQMPQNFDYVLIDSRTGHTDVGGICTRQLPDAVMLMFFPNEQNIIGLEAVVSDIRSDVTRQEWPVTIIFCASNVPDLDDEDNILSSQLDRAKKSLGYKRNIAMVRHYDSLQLLDQSIFVLERRKSRLAEEYRTLAMAVIKSNDKDREGALAQLSDLRSQLRQRNVGLGTATSEPDTSLTQIADVLNRIGRLHPHDGEIAWSIAAIFNSLGDTSSELDALGIVLDAGYREPRARIRRARILMSQGDRAGAIEDARAVLAFSEIDPVDLYSSTSMLRSIDADWVDSVRRSPSITNLAADDLRPMIEILESDSSSLDLAEELVGRLIEKSVTEAEIIGANIELALVRIGAGKYISAMDVIGDRATLLEEGSIIATFNYAMAEWGENGRPPLDLFRRVVELDAINNRHSTSDTNYLQCLSLAQATLGNVDGARAYLALARGKLRPGYVFSCWRYLRVDREDMNVDLNDMEDAILAGSIIPAFIARNL